ncbi:hypothetical protein DL770_005795 [Monosporascus sp. CRB-9-2]|nr:hypothetical protein DL770_005795 [Monosporascus sp. CRB-9-2]
MAGCYDVAIASDQPPEVYVINQLMSNTSILQQAISDALTPGDQLAILSEVRPLLTTRVPRELILMIVENLETEKDLLALAETCKLFYHASSRFSSTRTPADNAPHSTGHKVQTRSRKTLLPDVHEQGVLDSYSSAIQNLRVPLHIAAAWRHVEVVRILVAEGTDPLYRTKSRRSSKKSQSRYSKFDAIDWAITLSPFVPDEELPREATKVTEIIKILLKDLPVVRNEHLTHICCRWLGCQWEGGEAKEAYMSEIIRTLLSLGVSPNYVPSMPKRLHLSYPQTRVSRLHYVFLYCQFRLANLELLGLLLKGDVNINAMVVPGATLLQLAIEDRNTGVVRFLLERGADINLPDGTDSSPLHLLASHHEFLWFPPSMDIRIMEMSLGHGANPEIRDRFGFRPVDIAIVHGKWDIAGLLMMVEVAKRLFEELVFHEKQAWDDEHWQELLGFLMAQWSRKPRFHSSGTSQRKPLEDASNRANVAAGREARDASPEEPSFEEYLDDVGATLSMSKPRWDKFRERALKYAKAKEDEGQLGNLSAYKPPAKPSGFSSRKRKSEASLEDDIAAYKQNLDHIFVEDMPVDSTCNQVRGKINRLIDSGIMKKGEFCTATGLSNQNLNSFLSKKGTYGGSGCAAYRCAWQWFKQREIAGVRAGARSNPGVASRPDISNVYLPGEETDSVPVWDICDEIRRRINAQLKTPGLTQAQFCRDLYAQLKAPKCKGIQTTQLAGFRSQKDPKAGCKSTVFYAAYVYFEKLRLAESKPKSKHRLDMEEVWDGEGALTPSMTKGPGYIRVGDLRLHEQRNRPMSFKRSRAAFEADLQAQQSPYVLFGTPLPPLDPDVRDDGSYVPVWKQEVRDERGRKRLHGAFTGGWSAGYFNTVGSKEGWTPSTFVSSRSNRHKDNNNKDGVARPPQQRPEDFMDEEDLADAAEREKLQTAQGFAGLGSTEEDGIRRGGVADMFRVRGETMGVKLLKRMGWKEGQGIGPKIRRKARLDVGDGSRATLDDGQTYLFAPDDVSMIAFVKKTDRKGIGYEGESRLSSLRPESKTEAGGSSDDEDGDGPLLRRPNISFAKKKPKPARGGIGIGVLNDTGSDDDDPYEIGPRISYNRVIGGDKKKKIKPNTTSSNPTLGAAPVFVSRKSVLAKSGKNLRRCHDGRLPLDGFVFGTEADTLTSAINSAGKYPPPKIPEGWKSSKQRQATAAESSHPYTSTADAAKATKLDPKSRAALLGEAQLPGKSVFDFLSPSARDRLAAATGKADLPPALGEVPAGHAPSSEAERQAQLLRQAPRLDRETAIAALARGAMGGRGPYADDDAKRARYRAYLEWGTGFNNTDTNDTGIGNDIINNNSSAPPPPKKPAGMTAEDWLRELNEFHSCARIFKPMTGVMASRFTTSSSSSPGKAGEGAAAAAAGESLLSRPAPKPADPAEEAARHGMYGAMTRSVADFYPSRLLCKRFNVRPPAHVQAAGRDGDAGAGRGGDGFASRSGQYGAASSFASAGAMTLDEMMRHAAAAAAAAGAGGDNGNGNTRAIGAVEGPGPATEPARGQAQAQTQAPAPAGNEVEVKPDVNEALEGQRAQDDVLRAIFGDSSDGED